MNHPPEPPAASSRPDTMPRPGSVQLGKIFWGLLIILLGVLLLLHNFNVIDVAFNSLWRSWPILLIAAGASTLSLRGWLGVSVAAILGVSILLFILAVALGWLSPDPRSTATTKSVDVRQSSQQITQASISVSGGAGRIDIGSNPTVAVVKARLQSNFTRLTQQSTVRGNTQNVSISLDAGDRWWHGNYRNDLSVTLAESLPISLRLDAGASNITGDLSAVNLRRLDLDSGASDTTIKLGSRAPVTEVRIDVGMSSVTLNLPRSSGISLRIDGGLSSTDTSGLTQVSDGYYQSANYDTADRTIDIRGSMGMSNLQLEYY